MVPMLEARGLPKIDHLMGGRYTRAVIAWFDHQYGLDRGTAVPLAPDGVEDFDRWKRGIKAPGLTWRNDKPIWRASRAAIKSGFKPAWVNLAYFANDEAALIARCYRLTAEANEWIIRSPRSHAAIRRHDRIADQFLAGRAGEPVSRSRTGDAESV